MLYVTAQFQAGTVDVLASALASRLSLATQIFTLFQQRCQDFKSSIHAHLTNTHALPLLQFQAGTVDIRDSVLASQLSLTTQDLRFINNIVTTVDADWDAVGEEGSDFVGSDSWIRVQIEDYLLRMCGQHLRYVCDAGEGSGKEHESISNAKSLCLPFRLIKNCRGDVECNV